MYIGRTTIAPADRPDYAAWAITDAKRLESIAAVAREFEFDEFARDCELEASFLRDRAAQALSTLDPADALLALAAM